MSRRRGELSWCKREKAFPREKPPPVPSRKAYIGSMYCKKKRLPVCGSLFLHAELYTYVVFFCFFSSDTEEKKAPGRGSGGDGLQRCRREKAFPREKPPPAPSRKAYIGSMYCMKKRLPVCGSLFLHAELYTYVVFFCFFSSDTEEKKAPGRVTRCLPFSFVHPAENPVQHNDGHNGQEHKGQNDSHKGCAPFAGQEALAPALFASPVQRVVPHSRAAS